MSPRGQVPQKLPHPVLTASEVGDIQVTEYAYGLGPPDGILALHYPRAESITDFPESRNDFVHQIFWSPDGPLAAKRGGSLTFVSPDQALWIRRGAVAEVSALFLQSVYRFCVRRAPEALTDYPATVVELSPEGVAAGILLCRNTTTETEGLAARARLLAELAATPGHPLRHDSVGNGSAQSIARALVRNPADPTELSEWATKLHVSAKTLQREFERLFGMSFSAWRTQIRLRASTAMLGHWSVTDTAHRVGYSTASAYIAAFTREYGEPPGRHRRRPGRS